jgi:hypothetical protein
MGPDMADKGLTDKQKKQKHPGGRPTDYKPECSEQARKLCLLGATDKDLASFFEVNEDTITEWKKVHPEFSVSIKEGKDIADAQVAERLFQRALGYSHPEDKIFNDNGSPLVVPTVKHYPPDPTAAIFWLKNRQKAKWRDKQEVEHSVDNPLADLIREISKRSESLPAGGLVKDEN